MIMPLDIAFVINSWFLLSHFGLAGTRIVSAPELPDEQHVEPIPENLGESRSHRESKDHGRFQGGGGHELTLATRSTQPGEILTASGRCIPRKRGKEAPGGAG